jgi:hypothetical protein
VRKASDIETASLNVLWLGLSQPVVQSHPTDRAVKAHRLDECLEMSSNMHDASASAEVVVGPKICLYWERDGPYVAGLRASGADAGLGGPGFLLAGVAIWLAW